MLRTDCTYASNSSCVGFRISQAENWDFEMSGPGMMKAGRI